MEAVDVDEAETQLSRLLERVSKGEAIVLARSGRVVACLVPYAGPGRWPGRLRGRIEIAPDFDAPVPEEVDRAFGGEEE